MIGWIKCQIVFFPVDLIASFCGFLSRSTYKQQMKWRNVGKQTIYMYTKKKQLFSIEKKSKWKKINVVFIALKLVLSSSNIMGPVILSLL